MSDRTVQAIYRHGIRKMHEMKRGPWTKEEENELIQLVSGREEEVGSSCLVTLKHPHYYYYYYYYYYYCYYYHPPNDYYDYYHYYYYYHHYRCKSMGPNGRRLRSC